MSNLGPKALMRRQMSLVLDLGKAFVMGEPHWRKMAFINDINSTTTELMGWKLPKEELSNLWSECLDEMEAEWDILETAIFETTMATIKEVIKIVKEEGKESHG